MPSRTYEITFAGQADIVARAEFDDCQVSVGPDTTTLLRELPDQGALHGLIQRIADLGLELIDVSVVAPLLTSAVDFHMMNRVISSAGPGFGVQRRDERQGENSAFIQSGWTVAQSAAMSITVHLCSAAAARIWPVPLPRIGSRS